MLVFSSSPTTNIFKFQYDNTLREIRVLLGSTQKNLNSNMIIL